MSEERKYKLYCHTNKINGKRYYGITYRTLSKRFQNGKGYGGCRYFAHAINRYGWDAFTHELVADNLSPKEADALEKYYIAKYHTRDKRYGYNIQEGGLSGGGMSEEGRASSSAAHSGGNAVNARPVHVFDRNGKFLGKFDTIRQASLFAEESFSVSRRSALLKRITKKGHLFLFSDCCVGDSDLQNPQKFLHPYNSSKNLSHHRSEILVYDMQGKLIRSFGSVLSAAKECGVSESCVMRSASDLHQTSCGLFFRYKRNFKGVLQLSVQDVQENRYHANLFRPVKLFDPKSGELIASFSSFSEAQQFAGVSIWDALNRKAHTAGNYVCRYADEVEGMDALPKSELPDYSLPNRRIAVSQFDKDGTFLKTFLSAAEAERETGVGFSSISQCVRGRSKSAGGFVWKYAE